MKPTQFESAFQVYSIQSTTTHHPPGIHAGKAGGVEARTTIASYHKGNAGEKIILTQKTQMPQEKYAQSVPSVPSVV